MCLYSKCNELLLKIWLTPSSSSWEPNSCSASHEILCIVWNLKVHWHVHNDLALVPLPGVAGKIQWLRYPISLRQISHLQLDPARGTSLQIFPTQTHLSSLPSLSSAPPISLSSIALPGNSPGGHIMKLPIMQFLPPSCYFHPHRSKYSPQHPTLEDPEDIFLPSYERPSFTLI